MATREQAIVLDSDSEVEMISHLYKPPRNQGNIKRTSQSLRTPRPEKKRRTGSPTRSCSVSRAETPIVIYDFSSPSPTGKFEPSALKQEYEVISLHSDGEEFEGSLAKELEIEAEDSDDEYDLIHAGYYINYSENWEAPDPNKMKMEAPERIIDAIKHLDIDSEHTMKRYWHPNISFPPVKIHNVQQHSAVSNPNSSYIWAQNIQNLPPLYRSRPEGLSWTWGMNTRVPLQTECNLHKLYLGTSFKLSPGSIRNIEQKDGWVAVGSGSIGGIPDIPDEEPNIYNRNGSLITWHGDPVILSGHSRELQRAAHPGFTKHYAINDVKFDSQSMSFLTTGADCTVRVWEYDEDIKGYSEAYIFEDYNYVPHDMAFKPGGCAVAIAEKEVHVYPGIMEDAKPLSCSIAPRNYKLTQSVGAMVWGAESTSEHLFTSTEPTNPRIFTGFHKAFDLKASGGKSPYAFDTQEAGDAMTLHPDGAELALITRGKSGEGRTHSVRLYDVGRRDGRCTASFQLEPFACEMARGEDDADDEVNYAAFSPDGIYLALARSDNHTHVYDMRMLRKGLLHDFEHDEPCKNSPKAYNFGVVKAQWVQSPKSRLGLVTGGSDGCIRLWDPLKCQDSWDNGIDIAEVNSDVATFSLGDRFLGEYQLVVGDCAGEVTIFDRNRNIFQT